MSDCELSDALVGERQRLGRIDVHPEGAVLPVGDAVSPTQRRSDEVAQSRRRAIGRNCRKDLTAHDADPAADQEFLERLLLVADDRFALDDELAQLKAVLLDMARQENFRAG